MEDQSFLNASGFKDWTVRAKNGLEAADRITGNGRLKHRPAGPRLVDVSSIDELSEDELGQYLAGEEGCVIHSYAVGNYQFRTAQRTH
jgi:hypothetical protein